MKFQKKYGQTLKLSKICVQVEWMTKQRKVNISMAIHVCAMLKHFFKLMTYYWKIILFQSFDSVCNIRKIDIFLSFYNFKKWVSRNRQIRIFQMKKDCLRFHWKCVFDFWILVSMISRFWTFDNSSQ